MDRTQRYQNRIDLSSILVASLFLKIGSNEQAVRLIKRMVKEDVPSSIRLSTADFFDGDITFKELEAIWTLTLS